MGDDFDQYERDYLARLDRGDVRASETPAEGRRRVHAERVEAARKAAAEADLDAWDYVVLEMVRRGDVRVALKVGTMRCAESMLKLYCHGMAKPDRRPTFDDIERMQAFLDSSEHQQYVARLGKIMTGEIRERLAVITEIVGLEGEKDMLGLTEKGTIALQSKRSEIMELHDKMARQYELDRRGFYEAAPSYMCALPLMLAMGLGTGAMMSYMASMGDASCGMLRAGAGSAWDAGGMDDDWSGFVA